MNKYDIVFCDIDDTLNQSNGITTEYTREVMKKLKDKGIKVVVNTGRSAKYAVEKSIEAGLSEYADYGTALAVPFFILFRRP